MGIFSSERLNEFFKFYNSLPKKYNLFANKYWVEIQYENDEEYAELEKILGDKGYFTNCKSIKNDNGISIKSFIIFMDTEDYQVQTKEPYTLEQVKLLNKGDAVYFKRWTNLKAGGKKYTSEQNAIISNINDFGAECKCIANSYKGGYWEDYGVTWSFSPIVNSYELKEE